MLKSISLKRIRIFMMSWNFFMITCYAMIFMFSTNYIIANNLSRDFLSSLNYIPENPGLIFFETLILFSCVIVLMNFFDYRVKEYPFENLLFLSIETILGFFIMKSLYFSYNGIIYLIFCDALFRFKENKYVKWLTIPLSLLLIISNYDFFNTLFPLVNADAYFEVYTSTTRGLLQVGINFLDIINLLFFILFLMIYIANEVQENERMTQELIMVHQVNHELENYAAVSEKIAEDKERKRLAREIHDTLGHALTGIAAGVDACIAMIDINPEATKKQLMVISKVVRQGIVDVRNSLNKLRPGALEQHGFKGAIENMIEEFTSVSDLTISLDYRLDKVDFENTKEDILFRVIQESVTNAVRHGDATHIDISLYIEDNSLYLKIQDNGQGCEEIHYGFGLKQMKERLGMINGKVAYDGHHGFLTIVTIPLQEGELYD
ncbi:sensor histidine kinase [Catenibacterium sp.]|uniref:sensor histidine kinase n=1 Tax=Catenibacterium sp. TaxID=2049022 RepID=UPI002E75A567|nr:sensor histidine kinase [Catenibacterium sp.]MEE0821213.1 sensor histidine kinase [Catenibacterium sp.]